LLKKDKRFDLFLNTPLKGHAMKTPPLNTKLRTYDEFDCEDNLALKGELTLMFGQLAMCINPSAQYGGAERILWAVVGEHVRFTTQENSRSYQYGYCVEVDPATQTITLDWYASESDYRERKVDSQKIMHINEFGRFNVLFDKNIYEMSAMGLAWPSDPVKPGSHRQFSAAKGAVLGALIGDAAGGILEFMGRPPTPKEARNALKRMPGGGVFGLAPGQFTDDGEMTVYHSSSSLKTAPSPVAVSPIRVLPSELWLPICVKTEPSVPTVVGPIWV